MSSGLEHIWDDDDDGNVILASQRPNGEARKNPQPLFLGDSDDDMAGGPTNAQITEELDDADLDAILNLDVGEIDDIDLSTDFDTEAYRQESAARLRKNMTLHPILPSSSPPRGMGDDDDDGTGTKAKKGGKSTTNAGKTKRQQLKLDENRLLGEFGFPALIKDTKDFKPKGKGHEVCWLLTPWKTRNISYRQAILTACSKYTSSGPIDSTQRLRLETQSNE